MDPRRQPSKAQKAICALVTAFAVIAGTVKVPAQEKKDDKQPQVLPGTKVTAPRPGEATPAPEPTPEPPPSPPSFDPLTTSGRSAPLENNIGSPISGSEGRITAADITTFPYLRPSSVLELVPGLITTNQGGGGKANTYYLRGFLIDHGTDFAVDIDGIPMNLPTHAHGEGYLDLNSLIPELVRDIEFRKGPYYAQVGDYSTAGSASIHYVDHLPYGIFKMEAGQYAWLRGLVANSGDFAGGRLLYAVESKYNDTGFVNKEHLRTINGVFKYTRGDEGDGLTFSLLAYNAVWNGNNQVPLRAVQEGLVPIRGNLDPSDGGVTSRCTLNTQWWHKDDDGWKTWANIFAVYYSLDLFSDFTFFLDDPVHGDQRNQIDRRWRTGANINHEWSASFDANVVHRVGLQLLNDNIPHVGLHHSQDRVFTSAISDDSADEFTAAIFYINEVKWTEKVRTIIGLRGDYYHFNVDSHLQPINSGHTESKLFNPKAAVVFGPWAKTEFFWNGGYSYHTNDARGIFETVGPAPDFAPVRTVPGLVRFRGTEIGVRSQAVPDLTAGAALWYIHSDSELIFNGDSGDTSPRGASERYGIELNNTYRFRSWLTFDADFSASHARFLQDEGTAPNIGRFVPESLGTVFSAGPSVKLRDGFFANLRFRYFGPRYLIEDGSQSSRATQLFELVFGYDRPHFTFGVQLYNLFNSNGHEQDFFFPSALPSDPGFGTPGFAGVPDIHFKALDPFNARFYLTYKF